LKRPLLLANWLCDILLVLQEVFLGMASPISPFPALDVDSDGDVYEEREADHSRVWSSKIKDSNRDRVG
jgi:hypothetical protein